MSSFLGHSFAAYTLFSLGRRHGQSSTHWKWLWLGWLVLLASAPDLDYLVPALGSRAHRGSRITHSIALSLVLPLLTVGVLCFVKGLSGRRWSLSACAVLAGLSHLLLDFLVGVTPLPLLWPLSPAAFASPVGVLPSAGRVQISNYYFYRNLLIEAGVLVPIFYVTRDLWRGRVNTRRRARLLILLLLAGCFALWSISLGR